MLPIEEAFGNRVRHKITLRQREALIPAKGSLKSCADTVNQRDWYLKPKNGVEDFMGMHNSYKIIRLEDCLKFRTYYL